MKYEWREADIKVGQNTIVINQADGSNNRQYIIGYIVGEGRRSPDHYCLISLLDGAVYRQQTRGEMVKTLNEGRHQPVRMGLYTGKGA